MSDLQTVTLSQPSPPGLADLTRVLGQRGWRALQSPQWSEPQVSLGVALMSDPPSVGRSGLISRTYLLPPHRALSVAAQPVAGRLPRARRLAALIETLQALERADLLPLTLDDERLVEEQRVGAPGTLRRMWLIGAGEGQTLLRRPGPQVIRKPGTGSARLLGLSPLLDRLYPAVTEEDRRAVTRLQQFRDLPALRALQEHLAEVAPRRAAGFGFMLPFPVLEAAGLAEPTAMNLLRGEVQAGLTLIPGRGLMDGGLSVDLVAGGWQFYLRPERPDAELAALETPGFRMVCLGLKPLDPADPPRSVLRPVSLPFRFGADAQALMTLLGLDAGRLEHGVIAAPSARPDPEDDDRLARLPDWPPVVVAEAVLADQAKQMARGGADAAGLTGLWRRGRASMDVLHSRTPRGRDLRRALLDPEAMPSGRAPRIWSLVQPLRDDDGALGTLVGQILGGPPLFTLQGPPGTGKTTVIAEVILQLLQRQPGARVLLLSQGHDAVENALTRLAQHGKQAGFLTWREAPPSGGVEAPAPPAGYLSLCSVFGSSLMRLPRLEARLGEVVAQGVDLVVIDEAARAGLQELLMGLTRAGRTLLVGDQRQLPAHLDTSLAETLAREGLSVDEQKRGTFDRVFGDEAGRLPGDPPVLHRAVLRQSFRMHPSLGRLSRAFYPEEIESRPVSDRSLPQGWLDLSPLKSRGLSDDHRAVWLDVPGEARDLALSSASAGGAGERRWINPVQQAQVQALLGRLAPDARLPDGTLLDACVIGMYREAVLQLRAALVDQGLPGQGAVNWPGLDVGTVDAFQGQERDVVVVMMTRLSKFALDPQRLNVAFSRARRLLIVVGDRAALKHEPLCAVADLFGAPELLRPLRTGREQNSAPAAARPAVTRPATARLLPARPAPVSPAASRNTPVSVQPERLIPERGQGGRFVSANPESAPRPSSVKRKPKTRSKFGERRGKKNSG